MTIETGRMINNEFANQVDRKLDELKENIEETSRKST